MTILDQQHEVLATRSTEAAGPGNSTYRIELGRDAQGLHVIASRKGATGTRHPPFTRAVEGATASNLECSFESLCNALARSSRDGWDAAQELSRLFQAVMREVRERARIARQTTRPAPGAPGFDVSVVRCGSWDYEVSCLLAETEAESAKGFGAIDETFRATSLERAFERVRQRFLLLVRAAGDDDARRALLEESWTACERALAEARRHPSVGRVALS